jgi:SAM-dependent MidA family methyltransferase
MGYYSCAHAQSRRIGHMPSGGSDFVTAPELSPWFGQALARSVAQALKVTGTRRVIEFGAGQGTLAAQLLTHLGDAVDHYDIVEVSAGMRSLQREALLAWGPKVNWLDAWPQAARAVVVANELLDAMPVKLLQRRAGVWHERGVTLDPLSGAFVWAERLTDLRPPCEIAGDHDHVCEIHPQAQAFVRSLAEHWQQGAAFFIDYGFPEAEYYLPQRHMGTVMCHQAHRSDPDPLQAVGEKDITAHVNFSGLALSAQDAGLHVLGYTSQAHFLLNSGLLEGLDAAPLAEQVMAMKLVNEHEMGELFKVLALGVGQAWLPMGFERNDRSHRL